MEADKVHAAADLADAATYEGGHECSCGCEGRKESWARALLGRGWDLSRKVAIAGVAATAAPVIAPPIIILSIAGVALSIPFAACLASVAVTNRLMGALLPTAAPQPYYSYDLGDEESEQEKLVDASGAPDRDAPVFDYWIKTEDTIVKQNERFASLPLSREARIPEELVPLFGNEVDDSAEGEFASQKSVHELFVPKHRKQNGNETAMKVDNDYITMEVPSPGTVSMPEVPVFGEEDNMSSKTEDAPAPATESVQEFYVSDHDNKTENGRSTITVENESNNTTGLPGLHAPESSELSVPMLGDNNVMVQRNVESDVSVRKSGKDSHIWDSTEKTQQHKISEVMLSKEVSVSESQGSDGNMIPSKLEDEIAVETILKEEIRDTNTVTGEEVDVQLHGSTAEPEDELLQSRHRVAPELQAVTESASIHGNLRSNLTDGIVKYSANKSIETMEHYGEEVVPSMVTVDNGKDPISSRSRLNIKSVSDGMTGVGSKPYADHPNQTTCVVNRKHGKENIVDNKSAETESKVMDNKVSTAGMAAQDCTSKTLVPDDHSMTEDEAIVEMVLEQVTTSIDPVTGEVVDVEVDIIARETELLPLSDLLSHELQVVARAGRVDDRTEDTVKGDGEDVMSSCSTPYVSAINDDLTSVAGGPDFEYHHQTAGFKYKLMDSEFETKVLAEDEDIYTEEQLREQLNTIRTVTGYRAVPSLTLEGEIAGLYIFVGVEPPHSSGGASCLMELNKKLRFLKSIIGVE